ncbi:MAG TPA: response regulator [Xanthobacteraceae bacterium]
MIETDADCSVSAAPLAFVIDDDLHICQFVASTLAEEGIRADNFQTAKTALAALAASRPAVIFLDVALSQSDAIDVLRGLGKHRYDGVVQLMSGGTPSLLAAIRRIGVREGIALGEPLKKPVTREAIVQVLAGAGLSGTAARAERARRSPPIAPE